MIEFDSTSKMYQDIIWILNQGSRAHISNPYDKVLKNFPIANGEDQLIWN